MKVKIFLLVMIFFLVSISGCAPMQDQQQPNRQPFQQGQQEVEGTQSSVVGEDVIKRVKVITDKANIRNGCSDDAPVVQTSEKNKTLDVVNKVADWYAVKLPNDKIGFVPQDQVKPVVVEDNKPTADGGQGGGTAEQGNAGNANQQNTTSGNEQNIPNNTDNNNSSLTSEEQEMLRLVNEARKQNNVSPLTADVPLTKVARVKSQDMIDNNYFSHNSPTYGSPFDMMKSFGINYVKAGENIAGNQNVQKAHESLMNSPGHRQNILNPDYTHIGIGIKQGGQYSNMFTQMFISKPK